MAIYNLGSINADYAYQVPHLPKPGETIAATSVTRGLGGKGANMSVAAARAAAHVCHIGAVGVDGAWAVQRLMEYGVDTRQIETVKTSTAHAIITVDQDGENAIVLFPGANHAIPKRLIGAALSGANAKDTLLLQNETVHQVLAAKMGRDLGLRVAYAAAPFDARAVQDVLPFLDYLILNEVEADQLVLTTGKPVSELGVCDVIVTLGARGCRWVHTDQGAEGSTTMDFPAFPVTAVDTTGAGDTFTGYLVAGLDRGMPMKQAILLATRAAALMVTRFGTADVIPDLKEVQAARL